MATPLLSSWKACKRLIRYLQHTDDLELWLEIDDHKPDEIQCISDASWASSEDRRSTSGCTIWLQGMLLLCFSKTQATVAQSSAEAELIGVNAAVKEAKLIQTLLDEMLIVKPLAVFTDSTACLGIIHRRGAGRIRHLEVKQFWLQDELKRGNISIHHIEGENNVADIMTKAMNRGRFECLRAKLGLRRAASSIDVCGVPVVAMIEPMEMQQPQCDAVVPIGMGVEVASTAVTMSWRVLVPLGSMALIGTWTLVTRAWSYLQSCCSRRPPATRTVGTQSQCTYTSLRDAQHPRFLPLPEASSGVFAG